MKRSDDLRSIVESLGSTGFLNRLAKLVGYEEALQAKDSGNGKVPKTDSSKMTIREMYKILTG